LSWRGGAAGVAGNPRATRAGNPAQRAYAQGNPTKTAYQLGNSSLLPNSKAAPTQLERTKRESPFRGIPAPTDSRYPLGEPEKEGRGAERPARRGNYPEVEYRYRLARRAPRARRGDLRGDRLRRPAPPRPYRRRYRGRDRAIPLLPPRDRRSRRLPGKRSPRSARARRPEDPGRSRPGARRGDPRPPERGRYARPPRVPRRRYRGVRRGLRAGLRRRRETAPRKGAPREGPDARGLLRGPRNPRARDRYPRRRVRRSRSEERLGAPRAAR
jgi:hypothetical protein